MENLNKQNFFTEEWTAKYPKTSKAFCEWIDKYKERVGWGNLFTKGDKFHDIPLEMQIGIISKWFHEYSGEDDWLGCRPDLESVMHEMIWVCGRLEKGPEPKYCELCDGCGWYEGGPTLRTTCSSCNGTGIIN